MNDIVVLLPTLNEEIAIKKTIDDIQQYAPDCTVWVVDSSSDNTLEIAAEAGAVVTIVLKRDKGAAVREAIQMSRWEYFVCSAKHILMMDGDYTYPAKHIPEILGLLDSGYDVVTGYRHKKEAGAVPALNVIGNWGLSIIASIFYRKYIHDVCTGMWGFKASILKGFKLTSDGFTLEADLWHNAVSSGCQIAQIPIGYRARQDGSKSTLKVSDGFKIASFIIKHRKG